MPGFRILSLTVTGVAADIAREATALEALGNYAGAIALYERALTLSLAERPELPGFICGRLAAAYRHQAQYQDEVDLLERYRDSQTDEDARNRFDARISKARALSDKYTRSDSAALASVRAIKRSSRRSRPTANGDAGAESTTSS